MGAMALETLRPLVALTMLRCCLLVSIAKCHRPTTVLIALEGHPSIEHSCQSLQSISGWLSKNCDENSRMHKISYSKFPPKCAHARILVAIFGEIDCNNQVELGVEEPMHKTLFDLHEILLSSKWGIYSASSLVT